MPHSIPLETHANDKLAKITDLLKHDADAHPLFVELWLKANKQHPHHASELHLKTPHFDLHTHFEGPDMYMVIDTTIDKMVTLVKKEKGKVRDKQHKVITPKAEFYTNKPPKESDEDDSE